MSDFQSAYSISPRDSYGEENTQRDERDGLTPTSIETATGSMARSRYRFTKSAAEGIQQRYDRRRVTDGLCNNR
jgi:hypothetical protein